jgi:hypothetical protein
VVEAGLVGSIPAVFTSKHYMATKTQLQEAIIVALERQLREAKNELKRCKAREIEERRRNRSWKTRDIIVRVLLGESPSDVARSLGMATPPTPINTKLHRELKRANPGLYKAGIGLPNKNGVVTNTQTPPLWYLRKHRQEFGF